MSIYTVPNISNGIDDMVIGIMQEVPTFSIMLLVFVYMTILIGGAVSQKRRIGVMDLPMWSVMASLTTLLMTLMLTLREGALMPEVLSIVVVLTICSGIWLFLDRNRNEI